MVAMAMVLMMTVVARVPAVVVGARGRGVGLVFDAVEAQEGADNDDDSLDNRFPAHSC